MTAPNEFRHRLREAIADFNRQDVCDAIGKSMRSMTGWLNGSSEPLVGAVADLCRSLDVDANWLLGLKDKP